MPIRLLQVIHCFRIGGSELFGLELASRFKELGAEVFCAAIDNRPGPLLDRCLERGIHPIDLGIPLDILGRNGLSTVLQQRLSSLRLDGIHLQHFLALNKLGLPARLAGIPRVIVTEHSVHDVAQSLAGRARARLTWRLASRITVIDKSIKDYLCGPLRIPLDRVEVISLGVDVQKWTRHDRAEKRARLGIRDELVFAFVGRLAPVKNVLGLITAFLEIVGSHRPAAKLLIVGSGPDYWACEKLVSAHPHGKHVMLVGEQTDVRSFLAAADIFIMNSRSEGTPRALIEAMAMGLPAICPKVGGIPGLLNERGWLFTPDSGSGLSASIKRSLESPAERAELGTASQKYIRKNFDSHRAEERYWQLLTGNQR